MKKHPNKGISLVEVIVAAAIIGSAVLSTMGVYANLSKLSYQNMPKIQANYLAEEGIEAVRTLRDAGWSSKISKLSTTTAYSLYWNGTNWTATTTSILIDNLFSRAFTLSDVVRDANFNIASSSGTYDSGSKMVSVTVSWPDRDGTSTKNLQGYIFNTFNN
ncbi:MAG: hypothetical protein WCO16_01795 [bacterium]